VKVVLTGGGTGGHIYPGLALWSYLQTQQTGAQALYIGTSKGLEREIVAHAELPFTVVDAAPLKRQLSFAAVQTLLTTYRGYRQALKLLKAFRPDVVLGTGGYVTLPVIFAARRLGIPSVIWEANARPGLTNVLCARRASAVAVSFAGCENFFRSAKRVELTGNPRASEVLKVSSAAKAAAKVQYGIKPNHKVIVLYAGSRGAETVNRIMVDLIGRFVEQEHWQLYYVTGEAHFEMTMQQIVELPQNVTILPFIHDMPGLLSLAQLVISRSGGATLAEICALGLASILIPSPYVTANHQEENAKRLADKGAAVLLREADVTADSLWDAMYTVLETGKGAVLRAAARQLATPHAVQDLYQLMMQVMPS